MNEPIDTPINLDKSTPWSIDTIYNSDDGLVLADGTNILIADFPWLSFLHESGDLPIGRTIHVFGLNTKVDQYKVSIDVVDAMGFYMVDESAKILFEQESFSAEWNKLPQELEWLYGSKPYMTSKDMTVVLQDLREALDLGSTSEYLIDYIDTHTYQQPIYQDSYKSYGAYFEDDMLVRHGKVSKVDMRLGYKSGDKKEYIDHILEDNKLTLLDNTAKTVEILIQDRVGDAVAGQSLWIKNANRPPKFVYLTTDVVESSHETDVVDSVNIQMDISLLYNVTDSSPIYCETPVVSTERRAPFNVLVSNTGSVGASSLELRTVSHVLPSGIDVGPLSSDILLFDTEIIKIGSVTDSIIVAEYLVTFL
jgi:hypothetical protein